MLEKSRQDSSLVASDLASFKRQEFTFVVLNLALLAGLLLIQTLFASYWGVPSTALVIVLTIGFVLKSGELVWLRGLTRLLQPQSMLRLTWGSVGLNLCLALILTSLNDHEDSPYFVLMVVPILETAFRSRWFSVLGVVTVAGFVNFFFVWYHYHRHPPLDVGEYFEAGITTLMFAIVGVLVWTLVTQLRQNEIRLARNLRELEQTRERLLQEEKLAAVGRLSSAIAHEIRNPVSMISSSLATATHGGLDSEQREEMFEIAAKESNRLVTLTTDFLAYARPRPLQAVPSPVSDTVHYVADVCRAHAAEKDIELQVKVAEDLLAQMDAAQVQQALLNLVMNAVDAAPGHGVVSLRAAATGNGNQFVRIEVENPGAPIPDSTLARIFEPFFTTKPHGSGLGLAIARNIARAHGGDLTLVANQPEQICFSMLLPAPTAPADGKRK